MSDSLRGHDIIFVNGEWLYKDTMLPTLENDRDCGHCGKRNTSDGHDGCLGTLPDVMNACCGHGIIADAYVQKMDGSCVYGIDALNMISKKSPIYTDDSVVKF